MTSIAQHKSALKPMGRGYYWQDLSAGDRFQTIGRTITETDLVNFISVCGMLEAIFIDATYKHGAIKGRPVPGALTCAMIEGLQFQSLIQETGMAMLEMTQKSVRPVCVGDTIRAVVEITDVKPTSKNNRAIVTKHIEIFNQHGDLVMTYGVKRMLAGRPPE